MRTASRIVLLAVAVALLLTWRYPDWMARMGGQPAGRGLPAKAAPGIAYVLHTGQWLELPLTGIGNAVRVVTNASVPAALLARTAPETEWPYVLEYELEDRAGNAIKQGTYHHFTKVTALESADADGDIQTVYSAYFLESGFQPTDARAMALNFPSNAGIERMRLRVAEKDAELTDVVARVYMRARVSEYRIATSWKRIREDKRALMARGNIYPQDLLDMTEIETLLRNVWQPLGPVGVAGEDYVRRDIYSIEESEAGEQESAFIPPAGVFVPEGRRGVVPIPEGNHRLRIVFSGMNHPDYGVPALVAISWCGLAASERRQWEMAWPQTDSAQEAVWTDIVEGGLIEVSPSAAADANGGTVAIAVRAFLVEDSGEREITPEPTYLRAFLAEPGDSAEFPVHHAAGAATPFRLDLRRILSAEQPDSGPATVTLSFLDATMQTVATRALVLDQPPSPYDSLSGASESADVSEPSRNYFLLPPETALLRIETSCPVLAAAYTRPPKTAHESRVPEDYYAFDEDNRRVPVWFPLLPDSFAALLMQNRTRVLSLQYRPPEEEPDVLAGAYEWEALEPEGVWGTRRILAPRGPDMPAREEAAPSTFVEIPVGEECAVDISAPAGLRSVAPSLAYVCGPSIRGAMTVRCDGAVIAQTDLLDASGKIQLPAIAPGRRRFAINIGDDTAGASRAFLNYARIPSVAAPAVYLERWTIPIATAALTFSCEKAPGKEILSLDLFRPFDAREQSVVRVTIAGAAPSGLGPFPALSLTNRRYRVRPPTPDSEPLFVLDVPGAFVAPPERLFVVLDEDLPEGRYMIEVAVEEGPPGYILLSRTTPGAPPKRSFYIEERNGLAGNE